MCCTSRQLSLLGQHAKQQMNSSSSLWLINGCSHSAPLVPTWCYSPATADTTAATGVLPQAVCIDFISVYPRIPGIDVHPMREYELRSCITIRPLAIGCINQQHLCLLTHKKLCCMWSYHACMVSCSCHSLYSHAVRAHARRQVQHIYD